VNGGEFFTLDEEEQVAVGADREVFPHDQQFWQIKEPALMTPSPGKRSLRLVLVTETFPPEVNGVARTLGRWVEGFRARGHDVRMIRPRQPGESAALDRVYGMALPFYQQVRVGVASPLYVGGLLQHLKPDLVHIATEGPLGLSALMSAQWLGVPVASSFHTNFDHYAAHYGMLAIARLGFAYLRWFHNRTLVTLVPSQATRKRLTADGMHRVEIWSRGVDGEVFNPRHRDEGLRRGLGLGPDDPLLVYVGRLAAEKNLPALLQAFARLRSLAAPGLRERLRLALVGAGPLAGSIELTLQPGVVLAGEQHGARLSRWYASGDLFAFPSLSETFGNVMLEAQASGLPVVGYDCQGVNERVTPEVDGLLVPVDGDLAPALLRLCEDRDMRRRMGEESRAKAARQDWKPIFDELEERYLRLVEERRAKTAA
jgi:glycosyltransferase involved in cell wall biosynthesis